MLKAVFVAPAVHTCNPEGFGNNFIQAWLQGKPTITIFFDPDNIIEEQNLGFYSKTFNNLVLDTEKLINDKILRDSMGKRAREFARENFIPKVNAKKFEVFFNKK